MTENCHHRAENTLCLCGSSHERINYPKMITLIENLVKFLILTTFLGL